MSATSEFWCSHVHVPDTNEHLPGTCRQWTGRLGRTMRPVESWNGPYPTEECGAKFFWGRGTLTTKFIGLRAERVGWTNLGNEGNVVDCLVIEQPSRTQTSTQAVHRLVKQGIDGLWRFDLWIAPCRPPQTHRKWRGPNAHQSRREHWNGDGIPHHGRSGLEVSDGLIRSLASETAL